MPITEESAFQQAKLVWSIFQNEFLPRHSTVRDFDEQIRDLFRDGIEMQFVEPDEKQPGVYNLSKDHVIQ